MPLYIKDDKTAALVDQLARLQHISKQDAVKMALTAELKRIAEATPLRERLAKLREARPLSPATGAIADKAFFDELSDEL